MIFKLKRKLNKNITSDKLRDEIIDFLNCNGYTTQFSNGIIKFRKKSSGTRGMHLYDGAIFGCQVEKMHLKICWRFQSKLIIGYYIGILLSMLALSLQGYNWFLLSVLLCVLILFNHLIFFFIFKSLAMKYTQKIVFRLK